jgi:inhibitor of cysteine peptidase
MKVKDIVLVMFILMTLMLTAQEKDLVSTTGKITAKAIWRPGMETLRAIHDSCDNMKYPSFKKCLLEQMQKFGASQEAIEFAKMTDSEGFMRDFKDVGKVDIAYAVYPFRANENQVCFLVNGSPNMIDVDNYDYISKAVIKKNKIYKQVAKVYPKVSIWPGDRNGTDFSAVREQLGGGQQFIFDYRLQDGCHACKLIGFANLGFNFDKDGKFSAIKVINILMLNDSIKELKVQDEYSNPEKTIEIKAGQYFKIALNSNPSTGYGWQLAVPLNEKIVGNAGETYILPANPIPGAGGKEIWNFISINQGSTEISFKYIRPWEKNVKPVRESTFKIIVE